MSTSEKIGIVSVVILVVGGLLLPEIAHPHRPGTQYNVYEGVLQTVSFLPNCVISIKFEDGRCMRLYDKQNQRLFIVDAYNKIFAASDGEIIKVEQSGEPNIPLKVKHDGL